MSAKWDYDKLELEYIQGPDDLTPRKMAERDGASFSAYYDQYRKRDWERKRQDYRSQVSQKAIATIADRTAEKIAQIRLDALDAIHAGVYKMALDIQDHWATDPETGERRFVPGVKVTPDGLAKLIDRFQTLTGNPATITENRNLGVNITDGGLPPDVARLIADIAREREPERRAVGSVALPGAPDPRRN